MTRSNSWPDACIAELRRMKSDGVLSNAQIAERLGFSTSAIAGMWRRLQGKVDAPRDTYRPKPRKAEPKVETGSWDARLVEPYAQFKLRKQREREQKQCRG